MFTSSPLVAFIQALLVFLVLSCTLVSDGLSRCFKSLRGSRDRKKTANGRLRAQRQQSDVVMGRTQAAEEEGTGFFE